MPFALNESTRFISPTKTLEYLAGNKPVVSTAIQDVVSPYATAGLVQVAGPAGFAPAIARALSGSSTPTVEQIDAFISQTSWQQTWTDMSQRIERALEAKESRVA
jgi:hypothetical protein